MTKKIKIKTAYELIEQIEQEPKPSVIWNGIIEGTFGLISGVAKTGKTTFAENLAISLSVGRNYFFNSKLDGKPRKVLFVNMEESYKIRSRRNKKQIKRLSDKELDLFKNNFYSTPEDFPEFLNSEEDWQYLNDYINEVDPDVVFLDSLSHMCIGEIEKSYVAQQFVQTFKKYVVSTEKTVIVVHHNVKGNEKPIDMHSIAGSRFISQTFQYAYGFANSPNGYKYMCPLYNKEAADESLNATLYNITDDSWLEATEVKNKFDLYKNSNKIDYRYDSTNTDLIYKYFVTKTEKDSKNSQSSKPIIITTKELKSHFVENDTNSVISKDTLHKQINKLHDSKKIKKLSKGKYVLK